MIEYIKKQNYKSFRKEKKGENNDGGVLGKHKAKIFKKWLIRFHQI